MRTGLTLSGGGIRCVAHLAIWQALKENGISPDLYSGTSAGALVAALMAAGNKPEKILEILKKTNIFLAVRPAYTFSGLLNIEAALSFVLKFLPATFEELNAPVFIGTTNIRTGNACFFSKGPLLPPLLASCCVPVIFKPILIEGEHYADGGLVNNLPVEAIRDSCERVIGIHTNPVDRNFNMIRIKSLLERTFMLTINANVEQRKPLCDVFLEPDCLKKYKVFDFKRAGIIYQEVLDWIEGEMPEIKARLGS